VVRTSPGGATLRNKMNNSVHYGHVRHTLALVCAKNHLLIFSSFLDIWENVEWPLFWTTLYKLNYMCCIAVEKLLNKISLFQKVFATPYVLISMTFSVFTDETSWPFAW